MLAWQFFVPYLKFYSLLLPLALVTLRFRRVGVIISVCMWVIYGGIIVVNWLRL